MSLSALTAFALLAIAVAAGVGALLWKLRPEPELCPHCLGRGRFWWRDYKNDQIHLEDPCEKCGGAGMVQP